MALPSKDFIRIKGARVHNLKNISVDIPKNKLVVITGLSPGIAIDQRSVSKNPRSTVGTITEIYDYLRILFARLGEPHCPQCGRKVERQSIDQMVKKVLSFPKGSLILIL